MVDTPEDVTMQGFQKPLSASMREVRVAVISHETGIATCNCGWAFVHHRVKVLEAAMVRHVDKRHHGQAMWL